MSWLNKITLSLEVPKWCLLSSMLSEPLISDMRKRSDWNQNTQNTQKNSDWLLKVVVGRNESSGCVFNRALWVKCLSGCLVWCHFLELATLSEADLVSLWLGKKSVWCNSITNSWIISTDVWTIYLTIFVAPKLAARDLKWIWWGTDTVHHAGAADPSLRLPKRLSQT